jgi:hypothetical protein
MRLPSQGAVVQTDGDFGPSDFSIEISAHAFSVLSKGLYSDPFRAIVRELCCNAWDAHVEAGTTDRPFELFLPNALAPVFKIRDYGVGLSEIGIRKVYTTYFKSTKQQSDNMTGCFGLGSKSPYAYTKKFTIVSYYNGVRYHYNAIINEKGFPQILKMAEQPTDEPNGLEVSFSVNEEDFYDFKRAAKVALRPFAVKPVVHGDAFFVPDSYPEEPVLEGKGWKLFRRLDGGNICAMGNVEYPIEATRSGFSSNAKKVLNLSIVVDFPLGSFEMTPSRESIQWTEFSVHNINDRLEQIHDEIAEVVSQKVATAKTFWEAVLLSYDFLDGTGLRKLNIQPVWKGEVVKTTIDIPSDKGITLQKITAIEPKGRATSKNSASFHKTLRIDPVATTFYLADFAGADYRVGNYVRDHFDKGQHCYLVSVVDQNALKAFCDSLGIDQSSLVLASTLPKRANKGGGGNTSGRQSRLSGSKARAFQFKMTGSGYSDSFWDEAEIDLDEADLGVYVEISRWNPENTQLGDKPQSLKYALSALKDLGVALPDGGLVGIKTAHKEKFEEHENWKTIDEFIREKITEYWNSTPDFWFAYEFFGHIDYDEKSKIGNIREVAKNLTKKSLLPEDSFFIRFAKTFDRLYKLESLVQPFTTLSVVMNDVEGLGSMSFVLPHGRELRKKNSGRGLYSRRLLERYPLFAVILSNGSALYDLKNGNSAKALAEYITLMDAKHRVTKAVAPSEPPQAATKDDDENDQDEDESDDE